MTFDVTASQVEKTSQPRIQIGTSRGQTADTNGFTDCLETESNQCKAYDKSNPSKPHTERSIFKEREAFHSHTAKQRHNDDKRLGLQSKKQYHSLNQS